MTVSKAIKVASKSRPSKPKVPPQPTNLYQAHRDELLAAWTENPVLPTPASRRAWAAARNVKPRDVYKWYRLRGCAARAQNLWYELPVGTPPVLPWRAATEIAAKPEPVEDYLDMEALEVKLEPALIDNDSAFRAPSVPSHHGLPQPHPTDPLQLAPIDYFADIPYSYDFDPFNNYSFSHTFDLASSSSNPGPFLPPLHVTPPLVPAISEPAPPLEVSLSIADKVKSRGRNRKAAQQDLLAVESVQQRDPQHQYFPLQDPTATYNATNHQSELQDQATQNVPPALDPHNALQLQFQPPATIAPLPAAPLTDEVRISRSLYINLVSIALQYAPHSISSLTNNAF